MDKGEGILIPVVKQRADLNCVLQVNDTGSHILNFIEIPRTLKEIQEAVRNEFSDGTEQVAEEVESFLNEMIAMEAVLTQEA